MNDQMAINLNTDQKSTFIIQSRNQTCSHQKPGSSEHGETNRGLVKETSRCCALQTSTDFNYDQ